MRVTFLIVVLAVCGCGGNSHKRETEYSTSLVAKVTYRESYSRDDGHYREEYSITDTNGKKIVVNKEHYLALARRFGNHNPPVPSGWGWGTGKEFHTVWPGDDRTAEVVTTSRTYENRTQVSNSVFKYGEVSDSDRETFGLHTRPGVMGYYHVPAVLGDAGPTKVAGERLFSLLNGKMGTQYQVRVWVLVYVDKPVEAAIMQEKLWKGGRRNELVLCCGVTSDYKLSWARAFSWSDSESLKADFQTVIAPGDPLNLPYLCRWVERRLADDWHRKDFGDFDYID